MDKRPNLLFIMTDQQRRDTLGCYGSQVVATPALDRIAAEGVVCDHFFVNNPVCVPSRCSFLTGRYPSAHRSRDLTRPLSSDEIQLFDVLKDSGYRIGLSGKNHVLSHDAMARFDEVYACGHSKTRLPGSGDAYESQVDPCRPEDYGTHLIAEAAKRFIRESSQSEQPFALWLSFPDPHTPFQVPEPYASIVDPRTVPDPVEPVLSPDKPLSQQLVRQAQGMEGATAEDIRAMRAIYYGMVRFIDDAVADVMDTLASRGIDSQTLVVFTSDHGEYLGDHGMVRKSWHYYDCLLRVPLIMRWKGTLAPGRIRDTLMESVDVMPTLLELLQLPEAPHVQGKSFARLLTGEAVDHKSVVFAEAGNPGDTLRVDSLHAWHALPVKPGPLWSIGAVQGCMVRTREWKLCHYGNGEGELYDLVQDPEETVNRYGEASYAEQEAVMYRLLVERQMAAQDPRPSDQVPFTGK